MSALQSQQTECKMLRRFRHTVCGERGSVGILMALVMFFVCGMLVVTWNTYTVSRDKMRLQNAVDAAALENAVWQARGMNCLQHLNDEAYEMLSMVNGLYSAAGVLEIIASAVQAIPFGIGPVLALVSRIPAALLAGVGTYACTVVLTFISFERLFYQYASCIIGWISAQQMAAIGGADSLIPKASLSFNMPTSAGKTSPFNIGIFAAGLSLTPIDTLILPIEHKKKELLEAPWKTSAFARSSIKVMKVSLASSFYRGVKEWSFAPSLSKKTAGKKAKPRLPSPTFWIAIKNYPAHDRVKLFEEALSLSPARAKSSSFPVLAYGVAQAITGDVVECSTADHVSRPLGFGTGATARLVSLQSALEGHSLLQKISKSLFYH
ncbi:MAG: pilus assembly protein TadG-related protein [Kiritimatiellia bacterium]